jgi:hypothetical protein
LFKVSKSSTTTMAVPLGDCLYDLAPGAGQAGFLLGLDACWLFVVRLHAACVDTFVLMLAAVELCQSVRGVPTAHWVCDVQPSASTAAVAARRE